MRALVQRVSQAGVTIDGKRTASIDRGILVLLGITESDTPEDTQWLAGKIARLRIFPDEHGKMNLSVKDIGGQVLIISQFTLYGDCRRGNRPGFDQAADPQHAEPMYDLFCERVSGMGLEVQTGTFAADMKVDLINDGPVTFMLETP